MCQMYSDSLAGSQATWTWMCSGWAAAPGKAPCPPLPSPGRVRLPKARLWARELLPSVREGAGLQLGEAISRENGGAVSSSMMTLWIKPFRNHAEVGQPPQAWGGLLGTGPGRGGKLQMCAQGSGFKLTGSFRSWVISSQCCKAL